MSLSVNGLTLTSKFAVRFERQSRRASSNIALVGFCKWITWFVFCKRSGMPGMVLVLLSLAKPIDASESPSDVVSAKIALDRSKSSPLRLRRIEPFWMAFKKKRWISGWALLKWSRTTRRRVLVWSPSSGSSVAFVVTFVTCRNTDDVCNAFTHGVISHIESNGLFIITKDGFS